MSEFTKEILAAERAKVARLTSLLRRWSALESGAWHTERYDCDRLALITATDAALRETGGGE